jgi:hypothetical protein
MFGAIPLSRESVVVAAGMVGRRFEMASETASESQAKIAGCAGRVEWSLA